MKKFLLPATVAVILFVSSLSAQKLKNFSFAPDKPKPDSEVTINYNPAGTRLENLQDITMQVYQFGINLNFIDEYKLEANGNNWTGKFRVADTTKGILVNFVSGDDKDDNYKKGYAIFLFDDKGKYIPGTKAGLAVAYLNGDEPDKDAALKLFKEEFKRNPQIEIDYLQFYLPLLGSYKGDNANEIILEGLKKYENAKNLTEAQLNSIVSLYLRARATEKADAFKKILLEKYPDGTFAQSQKYSEFRGIKNVDAKIKFADEFAAKFENSNYTQYMNGSIFNDLLKAAKYYQAKDFLEKHFSGTNAVNNSNNLAWTMYEKDIDLNTALQIAQKGIETGRASLSNKNETRPSYQLPSEFWKEKENSLAMILDTYGAIELKLGKNDEVLESLTEAVKLGGAQNNDVNERFIAALLANGKSDNARSELEKFISNGAATEKMTEYLKSVYIKSKGSEEGFDKYLSALESKAKEKKIAKIKKEFIKDKAPKFTLTDLDGKKVSLALLKGKVVIVDFWATWCGPCLASFPGMKKVVEKFSNNPNVKFLFVNTWENVQNKKSNAAEFLKKNNYPFHVLLDEKNDVVANFKVSGIPTKFFIDKNGDIRHKAIGFDGKIDEMVDEISLIISMLE